MNDSSKFNCAIALNLFSLSPIYCTGRALSTLSFNSCLLVSMWELLILFCAPHSSHMNYGIAHSELSWSITVKNMLYWIKIMYLRAYARGYIYKQIPNQSELLPVKWDFFASVKILPLCIFTKRSWPLIGQLLFIGKFTNNLIYPKNARTSAARRSGQSTMGLWPQFS